MVLSTTLLPFLNPDHIAHTDRSSISPLKSEYRLAEVSLNGRIPSPPPSLRRDLIDHAVSSMPVFPWRRRSSDSSLSIKTPLSNPYSDDSGDWNLAKRHLEGVPSSPLISSVQERNSAGLSLFSWQWPRHASHRSPPVVHSGFKWLSIPKTGGGARDAPLIGCAEIPEDCSMIDCVAPHETNDSLRKLSGATLIGADESLSVKIMVLDMTDRHEQMSQRKSMLLQELEAYSAKQESLWANQCGHSADFRSYVQHSRNRMMVLATMAALESEEGCTENFIRSRRSFLDIEDADLRQLMLDCTWYAVNESRLKEGSPLLISRRDFIEAEKNHYRCRLQDHEETLSRLASQVEWSNLSLKILDAQSGSDSGLNTIFASSRSQARSEEARTKRSELERELMSMAEAMEVEQLKVETCRRALQQLEAY